jgi:hypothetical protein
MTVLAAIQFGQLFEVVWVSLVATSVVTVAFALVVREGGRSAEARRAGRTDAATLHSVLAAVLLVALVAIVVVGVIAVLKK